MAKLNIKRGDNVMVITGKDKNKTGKVISVMPKENRVIVEGVNEVTRATKPRSAQDKGGLIKKNAPIDVSNVMLVCPVCGKPSRVGIEVVDGKKVRVCKKCKASIEKTAVKAEKKSAVKAVKEEK